MDIPIDLDFVGVILPDNICDNRDDDDDNSNDGSSDSDGSAHEVDDDVID